MGGWMLVALPQRQLQLCLAIGMTGVFLLLLRPQCPRLRRRKPGTKDALGAAAEDAEVDEEACCGRAAQGEGPAAEELQLLRPRAAATDPAGRPGQAAADPGAMHPMPPRGPHGYQRVATADEAAVWGAPEGLGVCGAAQGSEPVAHADCAPACSAVLGPLGEGKLGLHPVGQASSTQPPQPDAGGQAPGPEASRAGPAGRSAPAASDNDIGAVSVAPDVVCRVTGAAAACSASAGKAPDALGHGTELGEICCSAAPEGQAGGALGCDPYRRAGPGQGEVLPVDGAACVPGDGAAGVGIRVAPSDAEDADAPAAQVASTRKIVAYSAVFATLSGAQLPCPFTPCLVRFCRMPV